MIPLKSKVEIEKIKQASRIVVETIRQIQRSISPGISTQDLDSLAEELIRKKNALSAFKGYRGFPANICTSVNEEIVHGIPNDRRLKEGDIISIDIGVNYENYFSDAAVTIGVGEINSSLKKLIEVARKSLFEGIKKMRLNNHLSDISYAIQNYVEAQGFSVVRQFVGHGIGRSLHEEPEIPNFGRPHEGPLLQNGMVFAIEPMINLGSWESKMLDNGWTAVTADGSSSAHFEHTVTITEHGPEILTN